MKHLLALCFAALLSTSALAQTSGSVPAHNIPTGLGVGFTGWGAIPPGTAGQVLTSNGGTSDPTFQSGGVVPGFASAAQYLAGVSPNTIIPPSVIYPTETTTTFGATTTFDFSTFINTAVTLTANIATMNVANVTAGKSGTITFIQSGAGSFTTVFNSVFKFSGGTVPSLTTGSATAVDVLSYTCRSATFCAAALLKDVR
jgi:hypothetical protein